MDSLGNIMYQCTLLHIICEHLHDVYTFRLKGTEKIHTEGLSKFHSLIHILFSLDASVFVYYPGRIKAFDFDSFDNSNFPMTRISVVCLHYHPETATALKFYDTI